MRADLWCLLHRVAEVDESQSEVEPAGVLGVVVGGVRGVVCLVGALGRRD